jgi:PIN domain nuclease of toxin-antitoxin system
MGSSALILLDTHVLVWLALEPQRLSRTAASAIRRGRRGGGLGVSAITLLELAVLFSHGHVLAPGTLEDSIQSMIDSTGVTIHPLTPTVAALAVQFPEDYPRDPADRLIGATARAEGVPLITRDEKIRRCSLLKTIW